MADGTDRSSPRLRDVEDTVRWDREAERAVLASVLLDDEGARAVLARVRAIVRPGDFYDPRHAVVFEVMCALEDRRTRIDILTTADELRARERLNSVGGPQFLGGLTDEIPTLAHCEAHARIVADHALGRRVELEARRLAAAAGAQRARPADLVAGAQRLFDVASARASASALVSIGDAVDEELSRVCMDVDETVRPTGIAALDRALSGGMREGDLVIPGGRPSSGKSALAFQVAWNLAAQGWPVVVASLEMPRISVVQRIVAQQTGMDLAKIRARAFTTTQEVNAYCNALELLRALPLRIVDRADLTPSELRAICLAERAKARAQRLGAVIVDYLQKMRPDRERDLREQEIAAVAGALKSLAKELACPVVAPAQLNRGVEGRGARGRGDDDEGADGDRPRLSDFRGSGEIEQEADIALGIHRPKANTSTRELWVLKQRNGVAGTKVDLTWEGGPARFVEVQPALPQGEPLDDWDSTWGTV